MLQRPLPEHQGQAIVGKVADVLRPEQKFCQLLSADTDGFIAA